MHSSSVEIVLIAPEHSLALQFVVSFANSQFPSSPIKELHSSSVPVYVAHFGNGFVQHPFPLVIQIDYQSLHYLSVVSVRSASEHP